MSSVHNDLTQGRYDGQGLQDEKYLHHSSVLSQSLDLIGPAQPCEPQAVLMARSFDAHYHMSQAT